MKNKCPKIKQKMSYNDNIIDKKNNQKNKLNK